MSTIEFSEVIKLGEATFQLNVVDPTVDGVDASISTIGTSTDQNQWVKVGPADTDWRKFLTTEPDGSFAITESDITDLDKYTQSEVNTALSAKADKFETYTKDEVNAISTSSSTLSSDIISDVDLGGISTLDTVAAGTSLQEFAEALLLKLYFPTFTNPSINLIENGNDVNVEVGTNSGLELIANFNAGAINGDLNGGIWDANLKQADRAGGVVDYSFDGNTQSTNSYSLTSTIGEGSNVFNVVVNYNEGAQPVDSRGDDYLSPLLAGSVSDSLTINGRRNAFYGVDLVSNDSVGVRLLGNTRLNPSNGTSFTINIPSGATSVSFAYPNTLRDVSSVIYVEGLNAEIKSAFGSPQTISVEGLNGFTAIGYKVYTYAPVSPYSEDVTYIVTI